MKIESVCILISGAVEFDDRPGLVRDALASSVKTWLAAVHRAVTQAKEDGHLTADADERQIVFEIHSLILGLHYEARFLKTPGPITRANIGFEHILARYRREPAAIKKQPAATSRKRKSTETPKE